MILFVATGGGVWHSDFPTAEHCCTMCSCLRQALVIANACSVDHPLARRIAKLGAAVDKVPYSSCARSWQSCGHACAMVFTQRCRMLLGRWLRRLQVSVLGRAWC